MKKTCIIIVLALASLENLHAGILANGRWSPDKCGLKPAPPVLNTANVEVFNQSVTEINQWQQQAKTYFECLVKEANTDNSAIAEAANSAQAEYRQEVEKISAEAIAGKKKLESK